MGFTGIFISELNEYGWQGYFLVNGKRYARGRTIGQEDDAAKAWERFWQTLQDDFRSLSLRP